MRIIAHNTSAIVQTDARRALCKFAPMDEVQSRARAKLQAAIRETGLDATNLARLAEVRPSTFTRFLSRDDVTHTLSARTLEKLEAALAKWRREQPAATVPFDAGELVSDPAERLLLRSWRQLGDKDHELVLGLIEYRLSLIDAHQPQAARESI